MTGPVTADPAAMAAGAYDLARLARATRLCDWMFDQFAELVEGRVAEVGPGIGTFSERILARGVDELLLLEPDPHCAEVLRGRFAGGLVQVVEEQLPDVPSLRARPESFDFVLCQNVIEHVEDDSAAVAAMAEALRPGGRLGLLTPAHPRLYGSLDSQYGHFRRYTRERLARILREAGLEIERLYSFNVLGIPGWWVSGRLGRRELSERALRAYDALAAVWRPLEERTSPRVGLSVIAHARKPG